MRNLDAAPPPSREIADCLAAFDSRTDNEPRDLRTFLSGVSPTYQARALQELVRADLNRVWSSGGRKSVVEYLREYPELSSVADQLSQIETELRQRYANLPTEMDVRQVESQPAQVSSKAPTRAPEATELLPESRIQPGVDRKSIGRYQVVSRLGSGSFGTVYLCRDDKLHRDVAVKLRQTATTTDGAEDLLHEARSAARLRHPNIVAVLDTGETDDRVPFIVYEYVKGKNLKERIEAGDVGREQCVKWLAEVADALHEAHKSGLVHRDVKPANVLIDEAGRTRLTDFGLAKIDDAFFLDDKGRVLGTVAYMSPEQAQGQSHWASPQSDIYALGVILYEVLCGRRPFRGDSSLDLLEQVKHRPPAPPRTIDDQIPAELEQICLKAMEKQPEARYRTAGDLAAALRAALAPPPAPARSSPALPLAVAGVAALVFVVSAVALAISTWANRGANSRDNSAAASTAKTPSAPLFRITVQRKNETEEVQPLTESEPPLTEGDKVQFHVKLDRPSYLYVYTVDSNGQIKRPFPAKGQSAYIEDQLWLPPGAERSGRSSEFYPVIGGAGVEMVLAAVADRALTQSQLASFEKNRFDLAAVLPSYRTLREYSFPLVDQGRRRRERGFDLTNTVESGKLVSRDIDAALQSVFSTYYGIVLRRN